MRSILDGHIVLSRDLAARSIYPPIDVLASSSRVMTDVASKEHLELASKFKEVLATYRQSEDLINIGAYKTGSNPGIDYAVSHVTDMNSFLKQAVDDPVLLDEAVQGLRSMFAA
jgi:flagellum-specific ATP synthase